MKYLIVSCVGTKVVDGPHLRDFQGRTIPELWEAWEEAVRSRAADGALVPAISVYSGSLWDANLEAYAELQKLGSESQLWIVSAGLGLISGDARIPGYGVTFKPRKEDSVPKDATGQLAVRRNREWWRLLTGVALVDEPRTLSDLFNSLEPEDILVMAMGGDYYSAVYEDLKNARPRGDVVLVGLKRTRWGLAPEIPSQLASKAIPYTDFRALRVSLGCKMTQVHAYTAMELIRHYRTEGDWNLRLNGL